MGARRGVGWQVGKRRVLNVASLHDAPQGFQDGRAGRGVGL